MRKNCFKQIKFQSNVVKFINQKGQVSAIRDPILRPFSAESFFCNNDCCSVWVQLVQRARANDGIFLEKSWTNHCSTNDPLPIRQCMRQAPVSSQNFQILSGSPSDFRFQRFFCFQHRGIRGWVGRAVRLASVSKSAGMSQDTPPSLPQPQG